MLHAPEFAEGLDRELHWARSLEYRMQLPERRKRVRVGLTWKVYFILRDNKEPIEGHTTNISTEGFYCLVNNAVAVGEAVGYILFIPSSGAGRQHDLLRLEGRADVLRIESLGDDVYGVACRVQDYKVLPPNSGTLTRSALS
jgi:hypothetical protein